MPDFNEPNLEARRAWDTNARFWDERMGEGNDFFNLLVWPAVERLLRLSKGGRLLDIACGNGVTSRRLAAMGASVVGIDFSETLIEIARKRHSGPEIDYRVVDATDHEALLALGEEAFEGALCNDLFVGAGFGVSQASADSLKAIGGDARNASGGPLRSGDDPA
jgi:2-polyprenyl-3-methyl-5-hydroxy-6-metoxy-1,4-benzoquinol methylase